MHTVMLQDHLNSLAKLDCDNCSTTTMLITTNVEDEKLSLLMFVYRKEVLFLCYLLYAFS